MCSSASQNTAEMYRHDDFRLLAIHLTSHHRPPCFKRLIIDRQGITAAMTSLAPCRLSRSLRPWVGEVGKPAAVLLLFEELLSDRKRVLGPDHPDTLDTRQQIAILRKELGDSG